MFASHLPAVQEFYYMVWLSSSGLKWRSTVLRSREAVGWLFLLELMFPIILNQFCLQRKQNSPKSLQSQGTHA